MGRSWRRPVAMVLGLLVLATVVGACSDDRGDDDVAPVATVRGHEIFASDVEELADDPGFLAFIGAPDLDDDTDLSQTDAGRRTLTWLIDDALVRAEVKAHDLEVDRDTIKKASDDLEQGEAPPELDVAVDDQEPMRRHAQDAVAESLATYATLDQWLRTIDPADATLHQRLVAEHPEVRDRSCGSAVVVDEADAGGVRDVLHGGGTLPQVPDDVTLVRTPDQGVCLTRGAFARELVDVLYGTPLGAAGEKRLIARDTGKPVVFFVVPSVRDEVPDTELNAAVTATLQRLHDEGGAAFAELGFSTVDPALDSTWGTWDPTVGVVAADADPRYATFQLPTPASTSTTSVAPAPPPNADSSSAEFVDATDTIVGGSGTDPGTSDLLARATAGLEAAIPPAWRAALPVQLSIISGPTSKSYTDGRIEVGSVHAGGDWSKLVAVMGHEFGHQVGFFYGSQEYLGAAPTGWPGSSPEPPEHWADCVSETYTGYGLVGDGKGPCAGGTLDWSIDWLSPGPASHPRTA